jgi:hypothetical protein
MTVQPNFFEAAACSLGIVTYLGRFETYFIPLIRRLAFLFPDYEINVFLNGHYDIVKQVDYLRRVTTFLGRFPNVRYVTNIEHQSLARGWNWLILMSTRPWVLILNDDIYFTLESRHTLENVPLSDDIFLLNSSFSHFLINKNTIRKVGWFDERFLGVGCEDHDYSFRLAMHGINLPDKHVHGIQNLSSLQENPGWAKLSATETLQGKYSQINRDVLQKKWYWDDLEEIPEKGAITFYDPSLGIECTIVPKHEMEPMPNYYPFQCIDGTRNRNYQLKITLLKYLSGAISYLSHQCHVLTRTLKIRSRWRQIFN